MREVPDDGRCAERMRIARIRRNGVAVDGIDRVFAAAVHADAQKPLHHGRFGHGESFQEQQNNGPAFR